MGRATIKSGSINLLNTIIGAGILAMPYGLKIMDYYLVVY